MTTDEQPPHLCLASQKSQREVDREWAAKGLRHALRELTANLIRVVRGAGKPHLVGSHTIHVVEAFDDYREKVHQWPSSDEIAEALSIDQGNWESSDDFEDGHETVVRGALQIVASRLLSQLTQERRGDAELMDGFTVMERIREENRRARSAAEQLPRQTRPRRKPKRVSKKA